MIGAKWQDTPFDLARMDIHKGHQREREVYAKENSESPVRVDICFLLSKSYGLFRGKGIEFPQP